MAEAQLQLVKMLPHQALKAASVEVNQFVVRSRADEPAGHRAAPFVERQFTQFIAPFLPYGLFAPALQRCHTGFFRSALACGPDGIPSIALGYTLMSPHKIMRFYL